jgi:hypothetical protein
MIECLEAASCTTWPRSEDQITALSEKKSTAEASCSSIESITCRRAIAEVRGARVQGL